MKTKLRAPALVFFLLLGFLWLPVKSAVVVQDITDIEFNALTTTYTAAWSVVYRGGSGGTYPEEIRLARNTAIPQVGGGTNTLIGNLTWSPSSNNDIQILIDNPGNISARANSTTVSDLGFTTTSAFNQVLVYLYDEGFPDSTSLSGFDVNLLPVRNMFADSFGAPGQSDVLSITGFGSQAPFELNALWNPGSTPAGDDQYVWIVAIQNTTIPEPSTFLLIGMASFFMLRRRK